MKFMKLGSRPDTFCTTEAVRYEFSVNINKIDADISIYVCEREETEVLFSNCRSVSSEVSSDLIVQVKGNRYLLHKVNFRYFCCSFARAEMVNPDFAGL